MFKEFGYDITEFVETPPSLVDFGRKVAGTTNDDDDFACLLAEVAVDGQRVLDDKFLLSTHYEEPTMTETPRGSALLAITDRVIPNAVPMMPSLAM